MQAMHHNDGAVMDEASHSSTTSTVGECCPRGTDWPFARATTQIWVPANCAVSSAGGQPGRGLGETSHSRRPTCCAERCCARAGRWDGEDGQCRDARAWVSGFARYRPGCSALSVVFVRCLCWCAPTSLSLPRPFPCPPAILRVLQAKACRYLYRPLCPPYCSCALRPSTLCYALDFDPRCDLSPPADSSDRTSSARCSLSTLQLCSQLLLDSNYLWSLWTEAYYTPRGRPRPLAASTSAPRRRSSREERAIAARQRCVAPESTLPTGRLNNTQHQDERPG
jgi:hypothetical protein